MMLKFWMTSWIKKFFFLYLVHMTHGKKSKTIYTDLKYNRYMTDDRNQKSGNHISKFCIHHNCNKEAKYYFWGMKPKYCIDHKEDYHVNIYKNPVSKICDHHNCNKTAIHNYYGMKPRYCFDHKDKLHVNIPKKHKLCYKHFISHSRKAECPKCKIKKSTKCDECDITASYNFPELRENMYYVRNMIFLIVKNQNVKNVN